MALSYGQKWAMYLLLAEHSGTGATKSAFRVNVDNNMRSGKSVQDAVIAAANEDIGTGITSADFAAPLKTLNAEDLRNSLALNASSPKDVSLYIPNGTTCPPSLVQKSIVASLSKMQAPKQTAGAETAKDVPTLVHQ
jgi:hypothetical protein